MLPDRSVLIGQKLVENAKSQMQHFESFSNNVNEGKNFFGKLLSPPHIFCQFFKRYFSYPKLFSFDLGIEVHKCIHSNFLTRNEMIYNAFFPPLQDYLSFMVVQRFDPTFMASDIGKRALESLTDKMYFKS